MKWRDSLRELLHNRLDLHGVLNHPLYKGLSLHGFDLLNQDFSDSDLDFREYLAIHVMCHRLLEKEIASRTQWQHQWHRIDAGRTAFKLQNAAQEQQLAVAQVLRSHDRKYDTLLEDVPLKGLIKWNLFQGLMVLCVLFWAGKSYSTMNLSTTS